MQHLTIDIGNSNIVLALFEANKLVKFYRLLTKKALRESYYINSFKKHNISLKFSDKVTISSVVPGLNEKVNNFIIEYFNLKPHFISSTNDYKGLSFNPFPVGKEKMGSDLFANSIAAIEYYERAALVVDLGTACTFSLVTRTSGIVGRLISNGIFTSFSSLISNAAQLNNFALKLPDKFLAKNTEDAIKGGICYSYKYLIEGIFLKLQKDYREDFSLIITGGAANLILPLLELDYIYDIHLTVKGIKRLGELI